MAVEWHEYHAEEVSMRYLVNAKYGMESQSLRLSGAAVVLAMVVVVCPLVRAAGEICVWPTHFNPVIWKCLFEMDAQGGLGDTLSQFQIESGDRNIIKIILFLVILVGAHLLAVSSLWSGLITLV